MGTRTTAIRLTAADLVPAAATLSRAFQDDPGTIYMVPDATARATVLPWLFEANVRHGLAHGEAYVCPGPMGGVAIWLPPGRATPSADEMHAAGLHTPPAEFGPDAFERLGTLVGSL